MINRTPILALALCAMLGLLVAGCGQKAETTAGDAVTGEVLPGSISDAMIDLDTSTAMPPMAPVKPVEKTAAKASASDAAPDVTQVAEPAAAPAEKAPVASADTE